MPSLVCSVVRQRSSLWWLVVSSLTVPAGIALLRRLRSTWAYRIPHPNKTVGDDEPEVIIVGSGVLGSSLAAALGMDGRRVVVIERDMKEPDRIVGELLQPGGVTILKQLLLEDCLRGIDSVRGRAYRSRDVDPTKGSVIMPVPVGTESPRSFRHGRFVQQLRKAAMRNDTVSYLEGVVLETLEEGSAVVGVRYRLKDSQDEKVLTAPLVVVADGIYSKFRKAYSKETPKETSRWCGLLLRDTENRYMETINTETNLIHMYQVSSNCTRIMVDLPTYYTRMPSDLKAYLKDVIYPQLPAELAPAFLKEVDAGRFKVQTLSWMPANPIIRPGVLLLGDALNVRHSLTAAGMTAALNDTLLARNMVRMVPDLFDYNTVVKLYRQLLVDRKKKTFSINVNALMLYHISTSPDGHMKKVRKGIGHYFAKDGFRKNAAFGLETCETLQPYHLLMHLTLAILYAIGLNYKEEGLLRFPLAFYQGVAMFVKSYKIMMPFIWGEIKTLV